MIQEYVYFSVKIFIKISIIRKKLHTKENI